MKFTAPPYHPLIIAILVCVAAFTAYLPALDNTLINWDTGRFVVKNPYITGLSLENLWWMLRETELDHWHPLTWLSYAVDYALFGLDAQFYHLSSVLLHCLNSLWVFGFTYVLLCALPESMTKESALWAAGLTALLFGVHPQHVESVAWVAERKDVLMLFFTLPALTAWLFYARAASRRARAWWYALSLLCFAGAVLSKSMIVTLPALLLVLDAYPLRRLRREKLWFVFVVEKIPFALLGLLSIGLTLWGQHSIGVMADTEQVDLSYRLLNACNNVFLYFSKWLLPVSLSPYYTLPDLSGWRGALPACGVLSLALMAAYAWHKGRAYWAAGLLFYIIALAPVSGIIQSGWQGAADRYAYLPTLPFYLFAGVGLVLLYQRVQALRLSTGAGVFVLLVVLGVLSNKQSRVWKDEFSLWSHTVIHTPESHLAHSNLAGIYISRRDYAKAARHYEQSIRYSTKLGDYFYLALAYMQLKRFDEALDLYEKILKYRLAEGKALAEVYTNLALLHLRKEDKEKGREMLQQALLINPEQTRARQLLEALEIKP